MPQTIKAMNTQINHFHHLQFSLDTVLYPALFGAYTEGFAVLPSAGITTAIPPG